MKVVGTKTLKFSKEEINILKEAQQLVAEICESMTSHELIDDWNEEDIDNAFAVLDSLTTHGAYINDEYSIPVDYH